MCMILVRSINVHVRQEIWQTCKHIDLIYIAFKHIDLIYIAFSPNLTLLKFCKHKRVLQYYYQCNPTNAVHLLKILSDAIGII